MWESSFHWNTTHLVSTHIAVSFAELSERSVDAVVVSPLEVESLGGASAEIEAANVRSFSFLFIKSSKKSRTFLFFKWAKVCFFYQCKGCTPHQLPLTHNGTLAARRRTFGQAEVARSDKKCFETVFFRNEICSKKSWKSFLFWVLTSLLLKTARLESTRLILLDECRSPGFLPSKNTFQ